MLKWPAQALGAIVKLFEPLQDVDVYVEDQGDEVFYTHLLQRLVEGRVRIARVFVRGNRLAVIRAAELMGTNSERALFLIDGDFDWALGRPAPTIPRLLRLPAYCVENFLVDEDAALAILMEDAVVDRQTAQSRLCFQQWYSEAANALVDLFAAFATLYATDSSQPTVGKGVGSIISSKRPGDLPTLDVTKARDLRDEAIAQASSLVGKEKALEIYSATRDRALLLARPLDIVSGKDFLLPLLDFCLRRSGCQVRRRVLRHRLALKCRIEPLQQVAEGLLAVAAGRAPLPTKS